MRDILRTAATAFVWGMVALILILAEMDKSFLTVAALALFATASTAAVWGQINGSSARAERDADAERDVKLKRSARERVARLVDELDDAAVQELGTLLEDNRRSR